MKKKFRSAKHKREHEEMARSWEELKAKYGKPTKHQKQVDPLVYQLTVPAGRESRSIPSRRSPGMDSTAPLPSVTYTGTEMLGIGQLHKSNAIPVFREQDAVDLSTMRR